MARRRKGFFGKLFSTILVVLLIAIVAIGASFFFYAPPQEHSNSFYDLVGFKRLADYTIAVKAAYPALLLKDITYSNAYYDAKDGGKGEGDLIEYAQDTDEGANWAVVVMCADEAVAKEVYNEIKTANAEKKILVLRRNKAVVYGTYVGVIPYIVLPL